MAGTITGTLERIQTQMGRPQMVEIVLTCTADAAAATYPATVVNTLENVSDYDLRGLKLYSVKAIPGDTPPKDGTDLTITDEYGVDLLGGKGENLIDATAKAVSFFEALQPEFKNYQLQVKKNAAAMAAAFIDKGYKVVSGGTDNHLMLIDLRSKFPDLTGKVAEKVLVTADITVNKNMVPFDSRSPFQTSGIRVGTPAITSRGLVEKDMPFIVELVDKVLSNHENTQVIDEVKEQARKKMHGLPLNIW